MPGPVPEPPGALWSRACNLSPFSLEETFSGYHDIARVPRLLHFLRTASKQAGQIHQQLEDGHLRRREREDDEKLTKIEEELTNLETLVFEGCMLLLKASEHVGNAAAYEEAAHIWKSQLSFLQGAELLRSQKEAQSRSEERKRREEAFRSLFDEGFLNACKTQLPAMREQVFEALRLPRNARRGPARRQALRELGDFFLSQGDFTKVLQILNTTRRDFDEAPLHLEYSNVGAMCALLCVASQPPTVAQGLLSHWASVLESNVTAALDQNDTLFAQVPSEATPGNSKLAGSPPGEMRRPRGADGDHRRRALLALGRPLPFSETDGSPLSRFPSAASLTSYAAVCLVVLGLERLRAGAYASAADTFMCLRAEAYVSAFESGEDGALCGPLASGGSGPSPASSRHSRDPARDSHASEDFSRYRMIGVLKKNASILGACTPADVAKYSMVCCLASCTARQVAEQLKEGSSLRSLLDFNLVALHAGLAFSACEFARAFELVTSMQADWERDLLLGEENTARLLLEIRRNIMVEYTVAFQSLRLRTVVDIFPNQEAATVRENMIALVERGAVPFRFDFQSDVLNREETRNDIHARVKEGTHAVQELVQVCQCLCLNISVSEAFGGVNDLLLCPASSGLSKRTGGATRPSVCVRASAGSTHVSGRRTRGRRGAR
ncbi:hypothetical protein CSUI_003556 [Cystoisospora suis]|uniref:Uncharacterized protein n=1 Tax=Cystoisospora suis TaxID=483139 RepID=A0A2C6L4N4_9APIC|nr:hypothetical protein CSUI_003556 [Cystoisospora suis]